MRRPTGLATAATLAVTCTAALGAGSAAAAGIDPDEATPDIPASQSEPLPEFPDPARRAPNHLGDYVWLDRNRPPQAGRSSAVNRLGDYVWIDSNHNGQQDAPEPGAPEVTVTVLTAAGAEVTSTTTDAYGTYLVGELPDGDYQVCVALKSLPPVVAEHMPGPPHAGQDTADSDADPATGCTEPVRLGPEHREDRTLDIGLGRDYVWVDKPKGRHLPR
ncbi:hypothetical protein M8C13_27365 [Crossiella sp. SN42]|uniref:SdrD B-like domain-containing protein n=1 Tax=Crossiella sp. SN42 TaxID=2944808 RepID=UPI00207C1D9D|nr:SdrD B-like domain-containing protein [Crossiella sp. SN42]MCO1579475.1 hypothetical protein [Crossiella sp. SN42]